ncbi:class I SAM-dependent methyltransferase [Paraflavitalea sp. CAU 1676]|uniref:CheR family methyltransferase n=1 Tax=Paraflavitalea sp. CAU 1676 TaxID=3032598 RepID=UPI0023D9EFC5|nr:class I SAM-dependent methyltransferase [Paraflavitalea sp. CAU 1676]MDF2188696.1 class I SAM-dependent methyltransferase [Paraflavitalea sp. CAU 1676]
MIRTNLFETHKDDIHGSSSVLDVGCGALHDLMCFEDSEIRLLQGIDMAVDQSRLYSTYFNVAAKAGRTPLKKAHFVNRYRIQQADLQQYNFGGELHNFIICRNVLHFFPDSEKYVLINRMHMGLEQGGLLYLQVNHSDNVNIIRSEYAVDRGDNVFENKVNPSQVFFLANYEHFVTEINTQFAVLDRYTSKTDDSIILTIRK